MMGILCATSILFKGAVRQKCRPAEDEENLIIGGAASPIGRDGGEGRREVWKALNFWTGIGAVSRILSKMN